MFLSFSLFLPHVYATSFDISLYADKTVDIVPGTNTDVVVSLTNVKDTDIGISACMFSIKVSDGITISSNVRSLGSWSYTPGNVSIVDTFDAVKSSSDIIVIPVKIDKNGSLTISNITCSTEDTDDIVTDNKTISFSVKTINDNSQIPNNNGSSNNTGSNNTGNNSDNSIEQSNKLSSDCDLIGILVNDKNIDFDTNILEYSVYVPSLVEFVIKPTLSSDKASYDVLTEEIDDTRKKIIIRVTAENKMEKRYTLFLTNIMNEDENVNDTDNKTKKFDYKFIFIGIILVLVLINILRIVMKKKKVNIES